MTCYPIEGVGYYCSAHYWRVVEVHDQYVRVHDKTNPVFNVPHRSNPDYERLFDINNLIAVPVWVLVEQESPSSLPYVFGIKSDLHSAQPYNRVSDYRRITFEPPLESLPEGAFQVMQPASVATHDVEHEEYVPPVPEPAIVPSTHEPVPVHVLAQPPVDYLEPVSPPYTPWPAQRSDSEPEYNEQFEFSNGVGSYQQQPACTRPYSPTAGASTYYDQQQQQQSVGYEAHVAPTQVAQPIRYPGIPDLWTWAGSSAYTQPAPTPVPPHPAYPEDAYTQPAVTPTNSQEAEVISISSDDDSDSGDADDGDDDVSVTSSDPSEMDTTVPIVDYLTVLTAVANLRSAMRPIEDIQSRLHASSRFRMDTCAPVDAAVSQLWNAYYTLRTVLYTHRWDGDE